MHVDECMTWRDEGYLEALTQETIILAKRVMAARSRVLVVTSFDVSSTLQDHGPPPPGDHTQSLQEMSKPKYISETPPF